MQKEEVAENGDTSVDTFRLTGMQRGWRLGLSGAMVAGLVLLRFFNPADGGFSLSTPLTQRLFGLPCPFCGITRGTHALLNGEIMQALYLNMATGFVLAVAFLLIGVWCVEAIRGQVLSWFMPSVNAVFRRWKMLAVALVMFWLVHLTLALSQQKWELLHVEAPLFPDFLLNDVSKK